MAKMVDTNQKEIVVSVREFADVVRCPHCGGFNLASLDVWLQLREKEKKVGRCKHCEKTFGLEVKPWVFN